ncbi:hypothetical protein BD410DRAFT_845815 [Rickenella mellea]|uniref:Uncharacterized protein n=1 Tax=Rickenella mellea TaxID=50990 RepID=A0A4Y7PIM0_9AGAM|nr:hypothetical protein BD410DRAFT_845815 [Rickenella mellea]
MARTNDNDAATIYWSGLTERWRQMKEMCGVVWMDRTTHLQRIPFGLSSRFSCISRISTFYMSLRSHVVCDPRATALLAHPDPWTTRTADRRSQPGYLMENREETALWWRLNFSMAMQGSRCGSDLPSDSQTPTPRITPSNSVYVNVIMYFAPILRHPPFAPPVPRPSPVQTWARTSTVASASKAQRSRIAGSSSGRIREVFGVDQFLDEAKTGKKRASP